MNIALVLLLSLTSAPAADPSENAQPKPGIYKKLGSITWNMDSHKLVWVVQKGTLANGEFTPISEEQFEISPDEATMSSDGKVRGFDGIEAAALHELLDQLGLYCAQSVSWWGRGESMTNSGEKATSPAQKPSMPAPKTTDPEKPSAARVKV